MDNFVVSARKYRPATFQTVVGQQHITGTLKNAIKNNQLAQAFLFCGPRGVGKTTCARILAKTINCQNLTIDAEACGECNSCISFQNGNSFNFHELDAASNNSVEDIRNLIEQVRIPPQAGKYKVYIIDEVHMLSQQAFNAFLKTLEEPPPYAIFILATTEKHKILPTILSRCQIFDFNRIRIEDMAQHLAEIADKEGISYDQDGLHMIAQKADGGLRDALSMFDQIVSFSNKNVNYKAVIDNLNILDYDYYFKLTDAILAEDVAGSLLIFDEILSHGFDGNHFITGLA
ncbi:MAG: DNA polymerase III subunit gamma/tau, partial [Daejeonella sp.]|nr:DNA polymerase III subunit gamma/tau [Daejeonella sp.]